MRELEGLSHEEIAAALGVSGGAARQAIYRARLALRDGFGLLVPLPLLRMLFDHGAEAAAGAAAPRRPRARLPRPAAAARRWAGSARRSAQGRAWRRRVLGRLGRGRGGDRRTTAAVATRPGPAAA